MLITFVMLFSANTIILANTNDSIQNSKPKLSWSGMVIGNAIFDSRQVVEAREGFLLLYPLMPVYDKDGNDVNAKPSFNQYAMTTRLKATLTAPEIKGVRSMAVIETDFTGASNTENNSLRLRHGYIKLEWKNAKLLVGQYWHPLDIPEMIPAVVSLNTGAPFRSFSRQPQIRFDQRINNLNLVVAAASQRDYVNNGPAGPSYIYLRNSALPDLNLQLHYSSGNIFAGIAGNFKILTPRIVTDSGYKANEHINCFAASAFIKYESKTAGIKAQALYGQSLNDHLMLGGYGVSEISAITNRKIYTNLNYINAFLHFYTKNERLNYSLFGGYSQNLGSKNSINGEPYARDARILNVWRISPAFSYTWKWMVAAAELEYTHAAAGLPDKYYNLTQTAEAGNIRLTIQLVYNF